MKFATMLALGGISLSSAETVDVWFGGVSWSTRETYLSFNLDTGSLYNAFDFKDPYLRNLVKGLGTTPTQLRIGGGAANNVIYTGVGGARGNCSTSTETLICLDASLWDDICEFAAFTGLDLVFDLSIYPRTPDNAWNATMATSLLQYTSDRAYKLAAWALGNEEEDVSKEPPRPYRAEFNALLAP